MFNSKATLKRGTTMIGKWNHHRYQVISLLGSMEKRTKYLVQKDGRKYAMKIGTESFKFFSEVNALKNFSKAQGDILGPSLYDVDDWDKNGSIVSFYITDYFEGETFPGKSLPLSELVSSLLISLGRIHDKGYCFGDLSPSNIVVERETGQIRFIDWGGITPFGGSIKEFTPWFDRETWFGGKRIASVDYDLFSVAMIIIYCITGIKHYSEKRFFKQSPRMLYGIIKSNSTLRRFSPLLERAIKGQYHSAREMRDDWHKLDFKQINRNAGLNAIKKSWVEILFVCSLACCCLMIWLNMY